MMQQTFKKAERLKSKKIINSLFSDGKSFVEKPFRIVWKLEKLDSDFPVQIAISVSKKNFSKAVDRNLIKRRIREIYRRNKEILYATLENNNQQCAFMIIYISKEIGDYKKMEEGLLKALNSLKEKL
ncbi:MAG: ribonuclease P protein component [Bacteroidia bacterium]|nr:ribonuclease P protein component [Bacteroidia bacterium]